jgi:hypothetical protein
MDETIFGGSLKTENNLKAVFLTADEIEVLRKDALAVIESFEF